MVKQIHINMIPVFKNIKWYFLLFFISTCAVGQKEKNECRKELINDIIFYRDVDTPPLPKDGFISLMNIVNKNIKIDDKTIKDLGLEDIKIVFEFIIDSNGRVIYNSIVEKNEFIYIKDTMISAINDIEWVSGKCNNIEVNSLIRVPITFQIG